MLHRYILLREKKQTIPIAMVFATLINNFADEGKGVHCSHFGRRAFAGVSPINFYLSIGKRRYAMENARIRGRVMKK